MSLHRVAVLAMPSVLAFEVGLPHKFLPPELYDVRVTSADGGPVPTSAGFSLVPEHGPEILRTADTVIVPGHQAGPQTGVPVEPGIVGALRAAPRVLSICTGAFVLAAAGLLDGRRATTHWLHAARFRELFPQVEMDADVLYVDEGDVLTSAGNAAGIDLLLHLLRRDHGAEVAARVARRAVVAPWREGGQAQFIDVPVPGGGPGTAATRDWALAHLGLPLTLDDLAAHAAMSVRTFTRRFRAETGQSPGRWLVTHRVQLARRLLEGSDLPVEQVAERAGFGTTVSLRQHLHAAIGMSPLAYRRSQRAPVGA
ncbi:helix-turn-helix domain-containing protein [Pseudonocardia ailaonensis]|uniref:Helix-turn-helix domain-containing protein n=1 Tax=Pseudonocardia ailaonensis TaxID=367279 RepID=A0ABN2NJD4_9PSEU